MNGFDCCRPNTPRCQASPTWEITLWPQLYFMESCWPVNFSYSVTSKSRQNSCAFINAYRNPCLPRLPNIWFLNLKNDFTLKIGRKCTDICWVFGFTDVFSTNLNSNLMAIEFRQFDTYRSQNIFDLTPMNYLECWLTAHALTLHFRKQLTSSKGLAPHNTLFWGLVYIGTDR